MLLKGTLLMPPSLFGVFFIFGNFMQFIEHCDSNDASH